jgi:hemerythrin-like metal-binding protein
MSVITWSEAMSVGVTRLDRDHQVLIGLINRLAACDAEADAPVVADVLAALVAYTHFHFRREERVMEACGYAALAVHQEEHRLLAGEVMDLRARFEAAPGSVGQGELLHFLTGWLNHHVLLQDLAYREAIADPAEAERVAISFGDFDPDQLGLRPAVHAVFASHG